MIAEAITDEDEDAIQNEVESNDQGDEAKEETLAQENKEYFLQKDEINLFILFGYLL